MTNEERQQAIEWLKRRPVTMAGAKRMYDLAAEALEAYVPDMNAGDMISRQAALEKFKPWLKVKGYSEGELNMLRAVINELENLPPTEPRLIRCRDCYWWTKQPDSLQGWCALSGTYPTGAFFCGNARKKPYPCDPEKNQDCSKTGCYINGGECRHTLNKEYAREEV